MKGAFDRIIRYLRWVYRVSEGVKGRLFLGTALGILRVVLSLLFVLVSKQMVDIATGVKEGNLWTGAA